MDIFALIEQTGTEGWTDARCAGCAGTCIASPDHTARGSGPRRQSAGGPRTCARGRCTSCGAETRTVHTAAAARCCRRAGPLPTGEPQGDNRIKFSKKHKPPTSVHCFGTCAPLSKMHLSGCMGWGEGTGKDHACVNV